jgi:pSer/pThr/pTyr-binding forkhead associated (FHA) protein
VLLIDLESTNGTLLNGVFLSPDTPARLADGDLIQVGQVMVRYAASTQRPLLQPAPSGVWVAS